MTPRRDTNAVERASDCGHAFVGGRLTEGRRAVMATAQEMQSAFTVPELASAARARVPSIGLASAYRAVASLEEAGWLERVGSRDGSALYVRCAQGEHHHHMVCTSCGVVEHAECPLDSVIQQAADAVGFTVESHSVELYGICRSCADMCEETA